MNYWAKSFYIQPINATFTNRCMNRRSNSAVSCALELYGDKWTLLIIRDLLYKNKSRFSELLNSEEGIASNILSNRLKRLEEEGFVTKETDPTNKSRATYLLSPKGQSLEPVLQAISHWAIQHIPDTRPDN